MISSTYCPLPFIHLHVRYDNKVMPCCDGSPICDYSNDFNWHTNKELNSIRQQMLKGEKPKACDRCWRDEDIKGVSMRLRANIDFADKPMKLISYDLRNDTTCNLSCRMCNPANSSFKRKEWDALGREYDSPQLLSNFDMVDVASLEHLYLAGGEPFLNPGLESFLDRCIKENNLDFNLKLNTNCSTNSKNLIDKLRLFNNVNIISSVDGYGEVFEYIRYPNKWNKFVKNLEIYNEFSKSICFNITVMNYNIASLPELVFWLEKNYSESIIMMHCVENIDIFHFTNYPYKEKAIESLHKLENARSYEFEPSFQLMVKYLIKTMSESTFNQEKYDEFLLEDSIINKHRNIKTIME